MSQRMYLDCQAIAELLDLNAAHVRDRLTRRRDFPAPFRIGGALRWRRDEIEDWVERQRVARARPRRARASVELAGSQV